MTTKVSKRGGARPGSGSKKGTKYKKRTVKTASDKTIARWEAAARKLKKETGKTVEDIALGMLLDDKQQGSVKASILKTYCEALIVKRTESRSEATVTTQQGPAIGLPPMKQDPGLRVVGGEK